MMEEQLRKLFSIVSIPAILIIFYMELESISEQVRQTNELTHAILELREAIENHCAHR